jgi:hypothetical protein
MIRFLRRRRRRIRTEAELLQALNSPEVFW